MLVTEVPRRQLVRIVRRAARRPWTISRAPSAGRGARGRSGGSNAGASLLGPFVGLLAERHRERLPFLSREAQKGSRVLGDEVLNANLEHARGQICALYCLSHSGCNRA